MPNNSDNSADRKGRDRREFLKRSGKTLAYSVPVIVSLQSKRLNAQQMTCASTAHSCITPHVGITPPVDGTA